MKFKKKKSPWLIGQEGTADNLGGNRASRCAGESQPGRPSPPSPSEACWHHWPWLVSVNLDFRTVML